MEAILRALAVYTFLLVVFRIFGKRSLAQITTFDFVMLLIIAETTQQALLGEDFLIDSFTCVVANPGAGASTLNVSNMFDLEPDAPRIARAEIVESDIPNVTNGQAVEISPEGDPSKVYVGTVLRRAAVFGARKLASDDPSQRSDERVIEVVVTAGDAPLLIGQRVLVKFMKPGETAGAPRDAAVGVPANRAMQQPARAG